MLDIKIIADGRSARLYELPAVLGPYRAKAEIGELIEALIMQLDEMDGDVDMEPDFDIDSAHDDGCGEIWVQGCRLWGSAEEEGHMQMKPIYGPDQTQPPTNLYSIWRNEDRRRGRA